MRFSIVLIGALAVAAGAWGASPAEVLANYSGSGQTVGCGGIATGVSFGGSCALVQGPSAPTRPAYFHPWTTVVPVAAPACTPYTVTQWATGTSQDGWTWAGSFWTLAGQRVPILYSTPLQDSGWNWTISCGNPGVVRYSGSAQEPRTPSPCPPGTLLTSCRPGLDPTSLLASVERQLPSETISATPPLQGLVGVPVSVTLDPAPVIQYATVDVTAPDLGDGDRGEQLHVVWVVEASPVATHWAWPDGTSGWTTPWLPQVAEAGGEITATVTYDVTAAGFWSDGISVHPLASVTVGALTIGAQLAYQVQQVQANLG